jgi:hypothetical protein
VLTPSLASRNTYRICLIVSSLFAGIRPSSWLFTRRQMPELLTLPKTAEKPAQVGGIKSERWAVSYRNGGRHQIGMPGRIASESTGKLKH